MCDEKPHVLYFWQLNDENSLLSHSLAKLSDNAKVDSDDVLSTAGPDECKNDETNEKRLKGYSKKAFIILSVNFLIV